MSTLASLASSPGGDFQPWARVATALLDDHIVRMTLGDHYRGVQSLYQSVLICLSQSCEGQPLDRKLIAAPADPRACESIVPDAVYVLPIPTLHVDPWTRITLWGTIFSLPARGTFEERQRNLGRKLSQILSQIGGSSAFPVYQTLWIAMDAVTPTNTGDVIDLLIDRISEVPHVAGSSPWWVASAVSAARRFKCTGPRAISLVGVTDE